MDDMTLTIPTKIYFGFEALEKGVQEAAYLFQNCVMIVTGQSSMKKLGYLNQLIEVIGKHCTDTQMVLYDGISPNPKVSEVNEAIKLGIEQGVDLVIGMGGGSAMDGAKAIAVGIGAGEAIDDYVMEQKAPGEATLPIIAIPSTAGTGSELSRGAIVSDPEKNIKTGIRGDVLFPKVAMVNPAFTYHIPEKGTREMGFDVLTHAAETYLSKKANAFTEMLSLEALTLVAKHLPLLIKNPNNHEARFQMSYASMIMGINLGNASTCLPHRLQYPIGAKTDTSHGAGLACLYPAWFYYAYDKAQDKCNKIASILSGMPCATKAEAAEALVTFMKKIKMDYSLSNLGIAEEDVEALARNVSGSLENDPTSDIEGIVTKIYTRALRA